MGVMEGKLTFKDIGKYAMFDRLREGMEMGDPDRGVWNCGQSVALIDEVLTCQEFVTNLINEAKDALKNVNPMFLLVAGGQQQSSSL